MLHIKKSSKFTKNANLRLNFSRTKECMAKPIVPSYQGHFHRLSKNNKTKLLEQSKNLIC